MKRTVSVVILKVLTLVSWALGQLNTPNAKKIWHASFDGDLNIVESLVNSGVSADTANKDGLSALHMAALNGHLDIVKLLVSNGEKVGRMTEDSKETPLHLSSANGHIGVVRFLISEGADATAPDRDLWTPLHNAAYHGHLEVVRALIGAGADANKDDTIDEKATPMYLASQGGHAEVVQYLLDLGADPRKFNNVRRTPLHIAANNGHLNVVRVLLSAPRTRASARDGNSSTAADLAEMHGHDDIAKLIRSKF